MSKYFASRPLQPQYFYAVRLIVLQVYTGRNLYLGTRRSLRI
jgi:hypothetical protein